MKCNTFKENAYNNLAKSKVKGWKEAKQKREL
jgi:hypothetical protein